MKRFIPKTNMNVNIGLLFILDNLITEMKITDAPFLVLYASSIDFTNQTQPEKNFFKNFQTRPNRTETNYSDILSNLNQTSKKIFKV